VRFEVFLAVKVQMLIWVYMPCNTGGYLYYEEGSSRFL